ncbi:MAG: hypothetical protein HY300_16460, partial [Verrucomicrobia bacterium]|nr:hypothetical protein [Verrucomicrobiota bacterium]
MKTKAQITGIDAKSVTILADKDHQEHRLSLTPHTEFYFHGAWGEARDFQAGQRVFVIATTTGKTNWVSAHALADEISMRAMSPSQPMDPSFEMERAARLKRHRDSAATNGLAATVLESDPTNHSLTVLVRRADAWFARSLRRGDKVGLRAASGHGSKKQCAVVEVRPDYARARVRLDFSDSDLENISADDEVRLFMEIPETPDFETPPDLGRFTARQDRIDYFLSTIYCVCGMKGDSCAGHWNTLAACQLHGCGMPNLMT